MNITATEGLKKEPKIGPDRRGHEDQIAPARVVDWGGQPIETSAGG